LGQNRPWTRRLIFVIQFENWTRQDTRGHERTREDRRGQKITGEETKVHLERKIEREIWGFLFEETKGVPAERTRYAAGSMEKTSQVLEAWRPQKHQSEAAHGKVDGMREPRKQERVAADGQVKRLTRHKSVGPDKARK
jgi:hypothetical protein